MNGMSLANSRSKEDCCVAQRESEIPSTLATLFDEIDRYENLCHRLTDKLSSVVSPCPPSGGEDKIGKSYGSSLANELYHQGCKLRRISNDLDCLLDRIEL
jgi:hypothetical protein